jgi:hypothetical protein
VDGGIFIDPAAGADLAYIQVSDSAKWYPGLRVAIEQIPLGPATVYSSRPDGDLKFQPIRTWTERGVPVYHIVWEKGLNGFRPMLLRFVEEEVAVVTGIAIERRNLRVPGLPGLIDYDDPAHPQIRRLLDRFEQITGLKVSRV